jgi:hypothetical protein
LCWADFKHDDILFGPVIVRSHYVPGAKKPDGRIYPVLEVQTQVDQFNIGPWLTAAVITDQKTDNLEKAFMHDYICSVNTGWTAEQVSKNRTAFYPESKHCFCAEILIQWVTRSGHWKPLRRELFWFARLQS